MRLLKWALFFNGLEQLILGLVFMISPVPFMLNFGMDTGGLGPHLAQGMGIFIFCAGFLLFMSRNITFKPALFYIVSFQTLAYILLLTAHGYGYFVQDIYNIKIWEVNAYHIVMIVIYVKVIYSELLPKNWK